MSSDCVKIKYSCAFCSKDVCVTVYGFRDRGSGTTLQLSGGGGGGFLGVILLCQRQTCNVTWTNQIKA
ncbi:hypothetical protein NECAME_04823 [Necator americanus]|uniref:Uncharacterized protein n=1 Tax=Necator americanus TaxID=51031 RepID=W2SMG3_NECAM|nr:hypothetical protein NECAME_04823 [Necator americanus]ETN70810.1 hypothetical protein NECAME_04823 [Necator americanus]